MILERAPTGYNDYNTGRRGRGKGIETFQTGDDCEVGHNNIGGFVQGKDLLKGERKGGIGIWGEREWWNGVIDIDAREEWWRMV